VRAWPPTAACPVSTTPWTPSTRSSSSAWPAASGACRLRPLTRSPGVGALCVCIHPTSAQQRRLTRRAKRAGGCAVLRRGAAHFGRFTARTDRVCRALPAWQRPGLLAWASSACQYGFTCQH
jgi:hypothetical protein